MREVDKRTQVRRREFLRGGAAAAPAAALAMAVEDLDAEHARMAAAGLSPGPIRDMQHEGKPLARFFFITDPDGYRTEVLQRRGRYQ